MSDQIRSGARESAPKMFSQTHPAIFDGLPSEFDWQMRPVLVVTIDGDPMKNDGEHVGHPAIGKSLAAAIELSGHTADQANFNEIGRYPGTFLFPRNLPWKSLPSIDHASFRYDFHAQQPLDRDGVVQPRNGLIPHSFFKDDRTPAVQSMVVDGVDTLVISSFELSDRDLRVATAPFDHVSPSAFPTIIHHGRDGSARIVAPSEVRRVRTRFNSEERFIFNHVVNFSILAGRALYNLAYEDRLPREIANRAMPGLKMFRWECCHPLVLQALHLIRKTGEPVAADDLSLLGVDYKQFAFSMANGVPFIRREGDGYTFEWTGTGKYQPWRFPLGRLDDYENAPPKASIPRFTHPVFDLFRWLSSMRLLGRRGDRFAITDVGIRFLDLIGPDSEDVDLPLRWRTDAGEWGSADDVPAMDRWLNRTFRSVKRRVSTLPAAPFSDRPYATPEERDHENRIVIRGVIIPIDDEHTRDPAIAAEIARIGRGVPISADSRHGILMDPPRLGCEPRIRAIWAGVPLGVFSTADVYQQRVDIFRDMDPIDAQVATAISLLPDALRLAPFVNRVGTRDLVGTTEPCARFIEPPNQMEVNEGDRTADVVHGQVLVVRDLAKAHVDLRRQAAIHRHMKSMREEGQTDGLRIYGDCETSATFAYGILIGRNNLSTGKSTERRLLKGAYFMDHMKRAKKDLAELHAFFDHPETSVEGNWVIDPEGTIVDPEPTPPQEVVDAQSSAAPETSTTAPIVEQPGDSVTNSNDTPRRQETTNTEVSPMTTETIETADGQATTISMAIERSFASSAKTKAVAPKLPRQLRGDIFSDLYPIEWLKSIDPDGLFERVRKNPMSVMSVSGVPDSHIDFLPGVNVGTDHTTTLPLVSVSRSSKKPQTENEYAQQLRSLVACGASVIFIAGAAGGVPAIYEANGPVLRMPEANAFEMAARVLLGCERKIAEDGIDAITVDGGEGDDVSIAEVVRKDGTVFFGGNWEKVHIPYTYLSAMWARIRNAVCDGKLVLAELVAMGHWEKRAKLAGVSSSDGPVSLADIPGIGKVRKRLEALYRKMEGNGGKVGIVFHGKPGTGKTMIARTLARETGRHFVLGSFAEWQSTGDGHLGTMLSAMRATFEEAKANQPALLFLDEMDSLGSRNAANKNDSYMRAVINSFLELVQGFHGRGDVVVVGATNFLKDLDPAITRSGRLGDHVLIDLPDRNEVREIIDWFARNKAKGSMVDSERYADMLVGCTPADIHSLFDEALLVADTEGAPFQQRHLDEAISTIGGAKVTGKGLSRFFVQHEAARLVSLHLTGGLDTVACARNHPGISDPTGIVLKTQEAAAMSSDLVRRLKFLLSGLSFASLVNETEADVGTVARPCIEAARKVASDLVSLGIGAGNKVVFTPLSDGPAVDKAMTEWLSWAHGEAMSQLGPYVDTVHRLANELETRKHMDFAEIEAFVVSSTKTPTLLAAA
ncbi:ATP-binding protein [Rhizobium laguerreae]|nr:ATP-binding protein [Rhizobium laguerreae]